MSAPVAGGAKLTTTWKDPSVIKTNFSKVVMTFISKDADLRRRVEGGLVRRIPRSVAANTMVPDGELQDREAVQKRLSSNGVDGAIVVRLVDLKREKIVTQGKSWDVMVPMMWDSWYSSWTTVNTASYVYEEKLVTIDITLYAVATAKPVWAGRLTATNPKNLKALLDDLVEAGSKELHKQKLI
jgi:hypothetical protein